MTPNSSPSPRSSTTRCVRRSRGFPRSTGPAATVSDGRSSGRAHAAADYLSSLELLASLRLCSNVMAQWAVQTALGGHQSIRELVSPGGRLYESRRAIVAATHDSRFLRLQPPGGAMYAFIG